MKNSNEKKFLKFTGKKKEFYEALMEARASFATQVQFHVDEALRANKDSAGDKPGMATHMADLGSDNSRHELELKLMTDEADVVELIEEAIKRLEDGDFGKCLDCGCEIPEERLKVKPYTRFCTKCKTIREKNEGPSPD